MESATIAETLDAFNEAMPWGSFKLGTPGPADPGPWRLLMQAAEPETAAAIVRRLHGEDSYKGDPYLVVGNYAYRELTYMPLLVQGLVFALQRRVLLLDRNLMVRDAEYLQDWFLLEPRVLVLEHDPLAGQPFVSTAGSEAALTDELFAEVRRTFQPVIDGFRANRFVAPANAWGSILDSLAYGFWAAGERGFGMDAAWDLWEKTIEGRSFPTPRRPRRMQYEFEGERKDIAVRAGCCLWYTTESGKTSEEGHYCTSCYLESDEVRLAHMLEHHRREKEEAVAGHD